MEETTAALLGGFEAVRDIDIQTFNKVLKPILSKEELDLARAYRRRLRQRLVVHASSII